MITNHSISGAGVALAHDYLTQRGGAERVVLEIQKLFPDAPIYTSVYKPDSTFPEFKNSNVKPSFVQRIPWLKDDPRRAALILPTAWYWNRIDSAALVIASSTGWAHGARIPRSGKLLVYCHNPARWLYQADEYIRSRSIRSLWRLARGPLRRWDKRSARRADVYIANSTVVAQRIRQQYGITAEVVHPPHAVDPGGPQEPLAGLRPGFWLTVSRGRGYKNLEPVIDGVRQLDGEQLVIVGQNRISRPSTKHVHWAGIVSDAQLRWLYANARALVSVSYEDFGLTPIEANAFGTPVAVLRSGGYVDSTVEGESGVFIETPDAEGVRIALKDFPEFDPERVRDNADRFSPESFGSRLTTIVNDMLKTMPHSKRV